MLVLTPPNLATLRTEYPFFKSEITSLINSKIDSNMSSKDFEKKVKEITSAVISELFKILWQRNTFWKDSVKR